MADYKILIKLWKYYYFILLSNNMYAYFIKLISLIENKVFNSSIVCSVNCKMHNRY